MLGMRHPFSRALYEQDGKGNVKVTATDGRAGLFTQKGEWISGEIYEADPQLCGWIGGPKLTHHRITD